MTDFTKMYNVLHFLKDYLVLYTTHGISLYSIIKKNKIISNDNYIFVTKIAMIRLFFTKNIYNYVKAKMTETV